MIYFIRAVKSGNIKIGYSKNPEKRKANLQTAHYEELEFIGIINGTLYDEAMIKAMFSKFNIRGEWYYPAKEILDYANKNVHKSKKNIVYRLENGEYRITIAEPFKFTIQFYMLAGSHDIKILCDDEYGFVFGVEGERKTLLSWLKSLPGITKPAFDEFVSLMPE